MILIDANLLLYSSLREMPQHTKARAWLTEAFTELPRVGLPWPSLLAYVRISTNPRIMSRPLAVSDAWDDVRAWLAQEASFIPQPGERHADIVGELLRAVGSGGELVMDAHLAGLAREHGLTVFSSDSDFARFPGVKWENPLVA